MRTKVFVVCLAPARGTSFCPPPRGTRRRGIATHAFLGPCSRTGLLCTRDGHSATCLMVGRGGVVGAQPTPREGRGAFQGGRCPVTCGTRDHLHAPPRTSTVPQLLLLLLCCALAGSLFYFHAETGRVSLRSDVQAADAIQRGFRDSRGKVSQLAPKGTCHPGTSLMQKPPLKKKIACGRLHQAAPE